MNTFPAERMLGGTGTLFGPPKNAQFNMVAEFIRTQLPQFVQSILANNVENENALNSRLTRFITNAADQENFFAQRESMEDETRGNSPAADIGIYLKVDDSGIDTPLITVFEGKRLSKKLPKKRRQEYVIGREEKGKPIHCGGIERFKLAIHGGKLKHAGMIGYLQDETPDTWYAKVNGWICDLCDQSFDPIWSEQEELKLQKNNGRVTEYTSIVKRIDSELHLTHLWVDLTL